MEKRVETVGKKHHYTEKESPIHKLVKNAKPANFALLINTTIIWPSGIIKNKRTRHS